MKHLEQLVNRLRYKTYNPIISRYMRAREVDRAFATRKSRPPFTPSYQSESHGCGELISPRGIANSLGLLARQDLVDGVFGGQFSSKRFGWLSAASMYEGWTKPPQFYMPCLFNKGVQRRSNGFDIAGGRSVIAFDSWGTSSHYHFLIDTIIPLWATRLFLTKTLRIDKFSSPVWWDLSDNFCSKQLKSKQEIFNYFLGGYISQSPTVLDAQVCYGYLSKCRPYLGPRYRLEFSDWTAHYLDKFRMSFASQDVDRTEVILVPSRIDRLMNFAEYFVDKYSGRFRFEPVDFASMSMHEQIAVCSEAAGMFGSEGAAFANQIFLPNGGLIAPVSDKRQKFLFHKPLAMYCQHSFFEAFMGRFSSRRSLEYSCLSAFDQFFESRSL